MSGSFERIVAIDLGKFKSVACVMQVVDQSEQFETIETSPTRVPSSECGVGLVWVNEAPLNEDDHRIGRP